MDGRARDDGSDTMNDDDDDDDDEDDVDYGYWSDDKRDNVSHMASHGAVFDTIWNISVYLQKYKTNCCIQNILFLGTESCIGINNIAW